MLNGISSYSSHTATTTEQGSYESVNNTEDFQMPLYPSPSNGTTDYIPRGESIIKYLTPVLLLPSPSFSKSENFCIYKLSWP